MHIELGITRKCIPSTSGAASSTLPGRRESLRQTGLAQAYQQLPAAFWAVKSLLTSSSVLVQYSESLPLVLACNMSPYGVGAVLSHKMPNGTEAPIAFFSRILSLAEGNYNQINKEALTAVAGIKWFHEYIYGRYFKLVMDHKLLLGLLAGDCQTLQVLSPRMSRWTVFLAAYNYALSHCPRKNLSHADALSQCPLSTNVMDPAPATSVLLINDLQFPVMAQDIAKNFTNDKVIAQVLD